MTTLESITNQMNVLEIEINRQQLYISKHGNNNDDGEYDEQWEQYKDEAKMNLDKWDVMKKMRDGLK